MGRILLTDARIVTGGYSKKGALAIDGERISGLWFDEEGVPASERAVEEFPDAEMVPLGGKILMAGGVDLHVHFREPGLTHKADIASESGAALLGGVTSFVDMPNTKPATTSVEAVRDKKAAARGRSRANYGFHLGATNGNLSLLQDSGMFSEYAGIKVFMGSSTGNMLVDSDSALREIFSVKGKTVLIHSEDEGIIRANTEALASRFKSPEDIPFSAHPEVRSRKACIKSTVKALEMAIEYGTRLHVLHVSTAEEVEMIRAAKLHNPQITAETSPNYLWFCDEDYGRLGGRIKCNPAIKTARDREALRRGLAEGVIDTVGTDHAPHLLSEKDAPYLSCPSGMPSIQHCLPMLLNLAKEMDALSLSRIASAFSERPAEIIGLQDRGAVKRGSYADLIVVDTDKEYSVTRELLAYKCGWSPLEGTVLRGSVDMVFLNGVLTVRDGQFLTPPDGRELEFH